MTEKESKEFKITITAKQTDEEFEVDYPKSEPEKIKAQIKLGILKTAYNQVYQKVMNTPA